MRKTKITIEMAAPLLERLDRISQQTGIGRTDLMRIFIRGGVEAVENGQGVRITAEKTEKREPEEAIAR